MANVFRPDGKTDDHPRWTVGVAFDEELRHIECALVCMRGRHAGAPLEIRHTFSDAVPREMRERFETLTREDSQQSLAGHLATWSGLRSDLAELHAAAIADLLAGARMSPHDVLAVGVDEPGLWAESHIPGGPPAAYLPLLDLPLLAERTGMNTVGAFPARDRAWGGRGGPILPLAEWILLKAAGRNRLLLHVGRTARLTFLPKASTGNPRNRIAAIDLSPGASLWQSLLGPDEAWPDNASSENAPPSPVSVSPAPELVEAWLSVFAPPTAAPNWTSAGPHLAPYLEKARSLRAAERWPRDAILQSGIETIARALSRTLEATFCEGTDFYVEEILLVGPWIERLAPAVAAHAPSMRLPSLDDLGMSCHTIRATCVAIMTFLHLDQVPSNLPLVTGADMARVLGELAPGSPQSWQNLLEEFTGERPAIRPLRSAL